MLNAEVDSILVVDDDDTFRLRLARAFRDRGFQVAEAANATEALSKADELNPSAAVVDLRLKSESGLDILSALVQRDRSIRAVVLTGYGSIGTAVEAVKRGAANYITKPVNADAVLAAFDAPHSTVSLDTPELSQVEWEHIQRVMSDCGGNLTQAAKVLGLHRRSLQRKLQKTPGPLK